MYSYASLRALWKWPCVNARFCRKSSLGHINQACICFSQAWLHIRAITSAPCNRALCAGVEVTWKWIRLLLALILLVWRLESKWNAARSRFTQSVCTMSDMSWLFVIIGSILGLVVIAAIVVGARRSATRAQYTLAWMSLLLHRHMYANVIQFLVSLSLDSTPFAYGVF